MQCGDKGIRGNDTNQKTYGYMAELLRRRNDGTDFLGLMFHVSMTAGLVVFHRRHGMAIENSAPDTYRGRKSGTKAIVRAKGGQGPGPFSPLCSSPSTSLTSAPGEGCYSAISDGLRPGKTPSLRGDSRAIFSSHESPRSGVNVSGLRPSLIAKHSLRGALGIILSPAQGEGCFSVINDGRSPGKTPSLRGDSRVVLPGFACDYFNDCAVPSFVASFVLSFVDS